MADTFKQVIATANRKKTTKQFSFDHITTQDFMRPMPIVCKECVPNQEVNLALESFVRLNPMVKPTFGRARVYNRAFFVPFRTIFPRWNEFLASEPIYSMVDSQYGLQTSVPVLQNNNLLGILISLSTAGTSTDYDISYLDSNNVVKYLKLGPTAHFAMRLFYGLGYKINWNENDTEQYSAMPLLAFVKVMLDWYYPSQYINSSAVQTLTPYLQSDSLSARVIPETVIGNMVTVCNFCSYNDSLYVDAWDRPVAPNNGVESQYSVPDITLPTGLTQTSQSISAASADNVTSNGTPISRAVAGSYNNNVSSFTQYQHDILKALTDYTTRHRLSGVRAVDRLLAEYGINLSSEIMKRSILLGNDEYNIQFGDVMSHTDTYDANNNTGAVLGDYSGKGIGYGNHVFNYKLGNEFGYLMVINSVIPDVQLYQGVNRQNKHKTVLDFWHADFDGLGVQAAAADEVYMPDFEYKATKSLPTLHTKVFGFVPRYAEYKSYPSVLNGLFMLNGNTDVKAYSFMRDLEGLYANVGVSGIQHGIDFVMGTDAGYYNRIFYSHDFKGVNNNFIFIHHFECEQTDETSPLYDTYDFKEVERAVEMHTQAAKVN